MEEAERPVLAAATTAPAARRNGKSTASVNNLGGGEKHTRQPGRRYAVVRRKWLNDRCCTHGTDAVHLKNDRCKPWRFQLRHL